MSDRNFWFLTNYRSSNILFYSTKDLLKYKIEGEEGIIGDVSGFLFDITNWKLKFLRGKHGYWLFTSEFVIPLERLGIPDNDNQIIPTDVIGKEVEHLPSTNWLRVELGKIFESVIVYWRIGRFKRTFIKRLPPAIDAIYSHHKEKPSLPQKEHTVYPQLRSLTEFDGYHVDAKDGRVGEIEDLILDSDSWIIRFVIASNPENKIMLPSEWINQVNPGIKSVDLRFTKDFVLGSKYVV